MTHRLRNGAVLAACLLVAVPANTVLAQTAPLKPSDMVVSALTYRGEHRWTWTGDDGEKGTVRLAFVALPSGDYLVTGSFLLDDAELGATGSGRWRDSQLLLDLTVSGGLRHQAPDAGKRSLYPAGKAPSFVDSAGFAVFRAALDAKNLGGVTQQYQTNAMTGDRVQGPVYRNGTMSLLR
jgi:hypothetical protein